MVESGTAVAPASGALAHGAADASDGSSLRGAGVPRAKSKPPARKGGGSSRPKKKVRASAATAPTLSTAGAASAPAAAAATGPAAAAAPPAPEDAEPAADATDANGARARGLVAPSGSMDEYRAGCQRLEKERHEKIYEAEKRRLYYERSIDTTFETQTRDAEAAYAAGVRSLMGRLLQENADRTKRIEEVRWGVVRDDDAPNGTRRHEMALRGRAASATADDSNNRNGAADDDDVRPNRRSRKGDGRAAASHNKVKLHLALDAAEVASDMAKITGAKRARDADAAAERRPKKRK